MTPAALLAPRSHTVRVLRSSPCAPQTLELGSREPNTLQTICRTPAPRQHWGKQLPKTKSLKNDLLFLTYLQARCFTKTCQSLPCAVSLRGRLRSPPTLALALPCPAPWTPSGWIGAYTQAGANQWMRSCPSFSLLCSCAQHGLWYLVQLHKCMFN